ncbi:MAG: hypothetical protein KF709_13860 [Gemmatimonadaceae bacterium]|nr:hypothetical protein [Gemmatimonadaceae bacterium]
MRWAALRWTASRWALALVLSLGLAAASAGGVAAQGASRSIEGRVTRALGNGRTAPISGDWVVLHRVGRDAAAPLDSMRLRADGSYGFRYRASGDSNAVYFVSAMRGGVAYFTPPTREPSVRGGFADLLVFDTTSAPIPIAVRGRHLIVTAPDSTDSPTRSVIEVYELSNDSTLTRVASGAGVPTFEGPLPEGVTEILGGQGDISPAAIRVANGRVQVFAPLSPGLKQFSFSYQLPATQASLAVHVEQAVASVEVLVEDPRGTATGADLQEVDPVLVDERPFKRFLATDVAAPALIETTMPGAAEGIRGLRVMLVVTAVGAAMLLGLGMTFMRGGPSAFARRRSVTPESLALEIAALDRAFEAVATPSEEAKAEHYLKRAQLKGRLSAALAKRDGLA